MKRGPVLYRDKAGNVDYAAASPRQVERVPRGAKLKLVYTVDNDEEALTDLDEIISALRLLKTIISEGAEVAGMVRSR